MNELAEESLKTDRRTDKREQKQRGDTGKHTGRNISMNNKREGCQWTLQKAELMEEKGKEEKRPMSHCCRSLSPYMEVVFSLCVCVRAYKWEGDKTSQGKNKICFHICRLSDRFQNALWHLKAHNTRTYKKRYVERLEEGWGGQRKRRKKSDYITILFKEGREKSRLCAAEPREWQTPSRSRHFSVPSLCDAPMHFAKQFGEVPNDWNVGSLHTLYREECTVRANMHVTPCSRMCHLFSTRFYNAWNDHFRLDFTMDIRFHLKIIQILLDPFTKAKQQQYGGWKRPSRKVQCGFLPFRLICPPPCLPSCHSLMEGEGGQGQRKRGGKKSLFFPE